MDLHKIKLVIWDLDETFWEGILSDNTVSYIKTNVDLVHHMTDCGVISSICSKNDEAQVREELERNGLWDYFVFNSINWTPKGERVKQIVEQIQLREVNVLFIDDNPLNRAEVKNACPGIETADITILPELYEYFQDKDKTDLSHERLNQYKVLEKKKEFQAKVGTNEDFLYKSNIRVQIKYDCIGHIDRIVDLVQRSNQLNFTKVRSNKDALISMITDPQRECGYVEVTDNFGDYGIVGFFSMINQRLEHFVFSCRTLGMGVEQYVYKALNNPELAIVGEVASSVLTPDPVWINRDTERIGEEKTSLGRKKIVFKGPCDITQIFSYIHDSPNIIKELVYVNDKGVSIESGCHTVHIIESVTLPEDTKNRLSRELPFGDINMFKTEMFDEDVECVIYSLFTDPNLGLYKEKKTGAIVAFGEYTNDLTDESRWDEYINNTVFTANCDFNRDNLSFLKENYEYINRLTPDEVFENIVRIEKMLNNNTLLFLCLGSEHPFPSDEPAYKDRHKYHKALNDLVRKWADKKESVILLDFNKHITGLESFTNNINHFCRHVYYDVSRDIINGMNEKHISLSGKSWIGSEAVRVSKNIIRPLWNKIKPIN